MKNHFTFAHVVKYIHHRILLIYRTSSHHTLIGAKINFRTKIHIYNLKMLCLYLLGQNCLHLTFYPYLSSKTYSCKYEKLPNTSINYLFMHTYILQEKWICWKCVKGNFERDEIFLESLTQCLVAVKGWEMCLKNFWRRKVRNNPLWLSGNRLILNDLRLNQSYYNIKEK